MKTRGQPGILPEGRRCEAARGAPALLMRAVVGALACVGFAAIALIVANAREPYGGPLEA